MSRGLSSVVRKCIHREIGLEYAVKIINMTADEAVQYSVAAEIDVFRHLPPQAHQYALTYALSRELCIPDGIILLSCNAIVFPPAVYLQDHFESPTFHFLVFEL